MKLHAVLLAFFGTLTTGVSAQIQAPLRTTDCNPGLDVPGNNPLCFEHDPKDYVLQLHQLDLDPNPPVPGQKLHIVGTGDLTEVVDQGSFVHVQVSIGWVTLLKQDFDLCENARAVDEQCPFHKGFWNISKEVELPKLIPDGTYTVAIQAYTDKNMEAEISCMKGEVTFKAQ